MPHPRALALLLIALLSVLPTFLRAEQLENELLVSGPQVDLEFPYGRYYHPGAAVLLAGQIKIPGESSGFTGGITITEGDANDGIRYEERDLEFPGGGTRPFSLPIRAPAGGAALSFSIWRQASPSARREEVFKASLAGVLKVLPRADRIAWECGASQFPDQSSRRDRNWFFARTPGEKLPRQVWQYENLDLLAIGPGGFEKIAPESRAAIKTWLLGGGRVLLYSPDALLGATREGWLQIPPDTRSFPSDFAEWSRMLGLTESEILRDRRGQPVWAKFRLGMGGGIFFFPSASLSAITEEGARTLDQPVLNRERNPRPDPRIWSQAYDFFGSRLVAATRRENSARWAALGFLGLSAALFMAVRSSAGRKPVFHALCALSGAGLLSALLANQFPAPDTTVARFSIAELSSDAKIERQSEYAYFEGKAGINKLTLSTPNDATLNPVYYRPEELIDAAVTWTRANDTSGWQVQHRTTSFAPPSPIYSANRVVPLTLNSKKEISQPLLPGRQEGPRLELYAPAGWTPERLHEFFQRTPRGFIWVPASGSPHLYMDLDPRWLPQPHPVEGEVNEALLRTLLPNLTPPEHQTRAHALNWLLERTLNRGKEYVIYFDDWDSRKLVQPEGALIRPQGPKLENAGCFGLYLLEVRSK